MVPVFVRGQQYLGSYWIMVIELLHDRRLPRIERDTGADGIDPHNLYELLDQSPIHMALNPQLIEQLQCIVWRFPFVITTITRHGIVDVHNGGNAAELTVDRRLGYPVPSTRS